MWFIPFFLHLWCELMWRPSLTPFTQSPQNGTACYRQGLHIQLRWRKWENTEYLLLGYSQYQLWTLDKFLIFLVTILFVCKFLITRTNLVTGDLPGQDPISRYMSLMWWPNFLLNPPNTDLLLTPRTIRTFGISVSSFFPIRPKSSVNLEHSNRIWKGIGNTWLQVSRIFQTKGCLIVKIKATQLASFSVFWTKAEMEELIRILSILCRSSSASSQCCVWA